MKKTLTAAAAALIVGLILGALLFRGGSHSGHDHCAAGEVGEASGKEKASIWTCSMHPQVQAPKPGKCPICVMDLIPLSSMGASDGEREFSMSEAAKKLAGITTTQINRSHPEAIVRLFGKVTYDETRVRTIAARFGARIERLFVDYTGITVGDGDHLAMVYSPELLSVQSELLTAKKFNNEKGAQIARDKLRLWGFSEKSIKSIEASGKTEDQLMIDAPIPGVVIHKNVNEGDYVQTGTPLFRIAGLDQVWVMLDAYESDTPWLRYGQKVEFTIESLPGKTFQGQVSFIAPELDPKTRTVSVRVNIPNDDRMLKPGMFASAIVKAKVAGAGQVMDPALAGKWISPMHPEIVKDGPGECDICGMALVKAEDLGYSAVEKTEKPPLIIPAGAVLHTGTRSVVYVEKPDTEKPTFEGREILIGPRAGDFYIVEAGLKEGERVVSEGGFVIDSALQIQAKPSMMLPGDAPPLYPKSEAPLDFLTQVDLLLHHYFALQKALSEDSLELSHQAAAGAIEQLDRMPVTQLGEASSEIWTQLADRFAEPAKSIAKSESLEIARTAFQDLSAVTDEMARRFGTAYLPVYEMHCPMAFENKGASWLQDDETLLNPYFGAEMLRCGENLGSIVPATPIPLESQGIQMIDSLVSDYFAFKDALVADDADGAQKAASKLSSRVVDFDPASLGHPEAAKVWETVSKPMIDSVQSAINAPDIAGIRKHLEPISIGMQSLLTRFGGEFQTPVYEAFCPMAYDNLGGVWLQADEEVLNPYFGSSMLKCGEIRKPVVVPAEEK